MTKKISFFLVLILSIMTFGSIRTTAVEAVELDETVSFTLHKLLFDFDKMPNNIVNDGYVNSDYADYETLNGAEFEVYDVTNDFNDYRTAGLSIDEAQTELAKLDVADRNEIASGITSGDGTVTFELPAFSNGNTAYLFHESNLPEGVTERATNLVVILPFEVDGDTIHLYPKNESESIPFEKEVVGNVDYAIGEPIAYAIRTAVPRNPQDYEVFRIRDTADSMLVFDAESLVVTIGGDVVEEDIVYSFDSTNNGFTLNFNISQLQAFRNQEMIVQYEMALREAAVPDENYLNEGSLEYDNNIVIDRDVVRTGGYRFVKVNLQDENETLADAHFIVSNEDGNYLQVEDGYNNWVTERENASVFISDASGSFDVTGLRYGRYYLEEIQAPLRYVLSETPIPFDVRNGTFNPRAVMNIVNRPVQPGRLPDTGGEEPEEPATPERPRLPITRGEEPAERPRLPQTGEMTNILLSAIGVLFIVSALVILSNEDGKRRKNK